jgi:uncharacterized protein YaaN involved in tellurite resistance
MTNNKNQDQNSRSLPQVEVLTNGDGSRFYKDIPNYRDPNTDAEAKAAMDALMATADFYDINTVVGFGKEAKSEVLAVSRRINERVSTEESFITDIRNAGDQMANLELRSISERVAILAHGGYDALKNNKAEVATGVAVGVLAGPLFGLLAALGLKGARTTKEKIGKTAEKIKGKATGQINYEAEAEAVRDSLRKGILEIRGIVNNLESARDKIPGYISEVSEMGRARVRAYSNLALAIGAGNELLLRFEEDILPAAQANGKIDMHELQTLQMSAQALTRNIEGHIAARAVSLQNATVLSESIGQYVNMQMKVEEHLTSSVPEWEGQIAQGNMLVDQYDLQKGISAADKKSQELMQGQENLYYASRRMHECSMEQGTYHLAQIAQSTEKMAFRLSQDLKGITDNRGKHVAAQQRVLAATEKLSESFHETAQARAKVLLSGPAQDATLRLGANSNDNADAVDAEKSSPTAHETQHCNNDVVVDAVPVQKKPSGPTPG